MSQVLGQAALHITGHRVQCISYYGSQSKKETRFRFPYLQRGNDNGMYFIRSLRVLNELIYAKGLKQCPAHDSVLDCCMNMICQNSPKTELYVN